MSAPPDARRRGRLLTPARLMLGLGLVLGLAVVVYALLVDTGRTQIPLLASGLAVTGLVLLGLALSLGAGAIRAGREGRGLRALVGSLVGGAFALAAAGCLGFAIILVLLWGST